jgi:toxin-antitoxin system PIN domain toxin
VTYLLDVNALLALGFHEHEFHERLARWIAGLGSEEALATCPITELGFVRVLCQAPQYRITIEQGCMLLARLKSARKRRFIFMADTHGAEHLPRRVKTGRQITDGHLCALAAANGATLATPDAGIPGALVIPVSL